MKIGWVYEKRAEVSIRRRATMYLCTQYGSDQSQTQPTRVFIISPTPEGFNPFWDYVFNTVVAMEPFFFSSFFFTHNILQFRVNISFKRIKPTVFLSFFLGRGGGGISEPI